MWDPYAEFVQTTLDNGLTIHHLDWGPRGRDWVAASFVVHAGAREDRLPGEAHLVEHCVSKNIPRWSYREMKHFFQKVGGKIKTGATGFPHTSYGFFVPSSDDVLATAFDIAGSLLFRAQLAEYIERERKVVTQEFNQRYSLRCFMEWTLQGLQQLFRDHWRARSVSPLGTPESISALSAPDLQMFYDMYYVPQNVSMVVVTGMPLAMIIERIRNSSLSIQKPGARNPVRTLCAAIEPPAEKTLSVSAAAYTTQPLTSARYWSVAALPGSIQPQLIKLFVDVLDDLLNEHVRQQRGWCYDIDVSWSNFQEVYEFAIGGNIAAEALDQMGNITDECIAATADRPDLFEHYRTMRAAQLKLVDECGQDICKRAADDLGTDQRILTDTESVRTAEQLTMDDIRALASRLKPEFRWTFLMSP